MVSSVVGPLQATGEGTLPPAATPREEVTLLVSAAVLLVGLFADGFSHSNAADEIESFVTPAHGLVLAGFLLCAAAVATVIGARHVDGRRWVDAAPPAWRQAAVAIGAFGVAFLGDGVWHTVFGIESDIDALLSPTHLVLAVSMTVVFSTPLRSHDRLAASRTGQDADHDLSWRVAMSVVATTLVVAFFLLYAWTIHFGLPSAGTVAALAAGGGIATELGEIAGLTGSLVVTAVLWGGATALLRRGGPPRGALGVLLVLVPVVMAGVRDFADPVPLLAFVVGAIVVETLVHRRAPRPRPATLGIAWAATVWTGYWLLFATVHAIGWEAELVSGQVVSAVALAWWLGVRATPLPVPPTDVAGDAYAPSTASGRQR